MNKVNLEEPTLTVVTGERPSLLEVADKGGRRKGLFSQSNRSASDSLGMNKVLEEMKKMNSMMAMLIEMQKQMDVGD